MDVEVVHIDTCDIHTFLYHFRDCLLIIRLVSNSAHDLSRPDIDVGIRNNSLGEKRIHDISRFVQMMSGLLAAAVARPPYDACTLI